MPPIIAYAAAMTLDIALHARREQIVREHMDAENRLDFDAALATFAHPRYELVGLGRVIDGAEAVAEYFVTSRTPFPDQRNELIALHHTDDAVVVGSGSSERISARSATSHRPAARSACRWRRSSSSTATVWCVSASTSTPATSSPSSPAEPRHSPATAGLR